jgi:FAD/FMN-containing dehydrogenase
MDNSDISTLRARVSGPVLVAGDPAFAEEVAAFNTAVANRPALVVGAQTPADVVEAVRFARAHRLAVAVQSTGHGAELPVDGGLLLSTRRLNDVSVDAAHQVAAIGAGARWEAVIAAAAEHGLAPVAGSSTTVGVAGYLLGGGLGPLARSHGFSSDYVVGLTVVTGLGETIEVTAEQHADLFWALRGGKVGLGVVTEVRLRLVGLPSLYAGSLFFEEAHREAVLRAWIGWTATAAPSVTTSLAIVWFPPLESIPAPFRGRCLASLRLAFPGATEEGARLAAPLRAAAPVYLDALGALPLTEVARIHNDPRESRPVWSSGSMLTHVDQAFATALLATIGAYARPPFMGVELRQLGEATKRDVTGGSAVGGRDASFTLSLFGADPRVFESELPAAEAKLLDAIAPWVSPELNINFPPNPRSRARAARPWSPEVAARLAEIRRRHDPDSLFG